MKIKDTFLLRNVAGSYIVVPTGNEMIDFNGMITLNESGAFLWEALSEHKSTEDLVTLLMSEYAVSKDEAENDVSEFVNKLQQAGIIEA